MNSEHLSMTAAFMYEHAGGTGDVRINNAVEMAAKLINQSKRFCDEVRAAEQKAEEQS